MTSESELFAILGEILVKSSNLEFAISELFYELVDREMPLVGGLVGSRLSLEAKLTNLDVLAPVRFGPNADVTRRIAQTLKHVREVKNQRNRLVHGQWKIDLKDLACDRISCIDSRWHANKSTGRWTRMNPVDYSISELRNFADNLGVVVTDVLRILSEVPSLPAPKNRVRQPTPADCTE